MNLSRPEDEEGGIVAGTVDAETAVETSGARTWVEELTVTLEQVAEMAVLHGANLDVFMTAARDAYLQASPELREYFERRRILEQMDLLRQHGLLAEA
jgi:hypothetical protein